MSLRISIGFGWSVVESFSQSAQSVSKATAQSRSGEDRSPGWC